jgi:uncharacterized membrane protein (UPF0127 family)
MKANALDIAGPDAAASVRDAQAWYLDVASGGPMTGVRVASTFLARFVGLMNRSSLAAEEGLLFVPGGSIHTLWMRFAIDVIFLDEQWKVLRIVAQVPPWRVVRSPRRTRYVLELAAGSAGRIVLKPGASLQWCRQQPTLARHDSDARPT